MPPRYIMQRSGHPLITWDRMRPPSQTRAADAASMGLGSLGNTDVFNQARRLPRGGAPEYIADGFGATAIEYGVPGVPARRVTMGPRGRGMRRAMGDGGTFSNLPLIGGVVQGVADTITGDANAVVNAAGNPAPAPVPTDAIDGVAAKLGVARTTLMLGAAGAVAYLVLRRKGRR